MQVKWQRISVTQQKFVHTPPFESFADDEILCHLRAAKDVVPFKTFSIPHSNSCAKYFGGIAFGADVFLRCHTDEDFTWSVVQVYLKGVDSYHVDNPVIAYFCFPTIGVAVPMRPGNFLLFDATVPHCISARCNPLDTVMSISFYLKSKVVGLNNNSQVLTEQQHSLSSSYHSLSQDAIARI